MTPFVRRTIVLGPARCSPRLFPLAGSGAIDAIRESRGATMFVCSLADMQGETWGLSAKEHYEALARHGMDGLVDYMLVHSPEPLRPARRLDRMTAALRRVPETLPARSEQEASAIRPVRISYEDACAIQRPSCRAGSSLVTTSSHLA
ncbi:MAG: hypothetical protein ACLTQI_03250 [Slackia sp.]